MSKSTPRNRIIRTPEFVAEVRRFKACGLTNEAIAQRLGASPYVVGRALRLGAANVDRVAQGRDLFRDRFFGGAEPSLWTHERVVAAMRRWARRTGSAPTYAEWSRPNGIGGGLARPSYRRASRPSPHTVARLFGSWNAAVEAAGLEVRRPASDVAKARIISAIRRFADEHGRPPTCREWKRSERDHPSSTTVRDRFGSWSAAIEAAGFEPLKRGGHTRPHCRRGHELTPDNTYWFPKSGRRKCRTCSRETRRRRDALKRRGNAG